MKNWMFGLGAFACLSFVLSSCLKDNSNNIPAPDCSTVTTTAPNDEVNTLKNRLDSIGVFSRVQDPRGFFYKMDSTTAIDSGAHATVCSAVAVTYKLSIVGSDSVLEKADSAIVINSLLGTIAGWQEAVPLMKKNATMTLYLPPGLAYGAAGKGKVPGNAYISFIIKLYDFSN